MAIKIIPAQKLHAPFIAKAIIMAIGNELAQSLAGDNHSVADVTDLFTTLAQREDSQYSYLNTLIAVTDDGCVAGLIVSYDGADLYRLRTAFFEEAAKAIELKMTGTPTDETDPEELYIDTIAIFPDYRRQGIARELITAACHRAKAINKPTGLLVSKHNENARQLYSSMGFTQVGERIFAGELMDHLIKY